MAVMDTNNIIVVSDMHVGCRLGLMHPDGATLDDGGKTMPSPAQRKMWDVWEYFWQEWVPTRTRGEKYVIVINGDAMEGVHHKAITQWSQNDATDQVNHGVKILGPIVSGKKVLAYYHIRGSTAHAGESGKNEETLARELGARPRGSDADEDGDLDLSQGQEGVQHARWEIYKRIGSKNGGEGGSPIHILHTIGTTGSQHYESTALLKEHIEALVEAARWGREAPGGIVRSHRHRAFQIRIPAILRGLPHSSEAVALITAGWQMKTPFAHRIAGARVSQPQFGGALVSVHKGELYGVLYTKPLERPSDE